MDPSRGESLKARYSDYCERFAPSREHQFIISSLTLIETLVAVARTSFEHGEWLLGDMPDVAFVGVQAGRNVD